MWTEQVITENIGLFIPGAWVRMFARTRARKKYTAQQGEMDGISGR
jgi:hypothetical protein